MNFLGFLDKKKKDTSNVQSKKFTKKKLFQSRLPTEMAQLRESEKPQSYKTQISQSIKNCEQTKVNVTKYKIHKQVIQKLIKSIRQYFSQQFQILHVYDIQKKFVTNSQLQQISLHFYLLRTRFFRFQEIDHVQTLKNYENLIKASKNIFKKIDQTKNLLIDKGYIYVKNQEQFCQFFRHIFGKPLREFNNKYVRKILQQMWYFSYFQQSETQKLLNTLKLWAHGIMLPENPTRIKLHQAIFRTDSKYIEKACQLKLNSPIYCHANQADALGITPIMLAIYLNKQQLLPSLFLQGADPFLVPMSRFQNPQSIFQQIKREVSNKNKNSNLLLNTLQKTPATQRHMKNILQYTKDLNDMKLMAHLMTMQQTRDLYSLLDRKQLITELQNIPDCSFQLLWKSQSKFSLMGSLPSDIITVYKKKTQLRIDFNIIDLFQKQSFKKGKFTLILKAKPELQFYFIDQNNKKIISLIKEAQLKDIEKRCQTFLKQGDKQHQSIIECRSQQKIIKNYNNMTAKKINIELTYQHQDIKKTQNFFPFKTMAQYQKVLLNSEIIDYNKLCQSNIRYSKNEIINANLKTKSKNVTSKTNFEITSLPCFDFNLKHINTILKIIKNYSKTFERFQKFIDYQKMLYQIGKKNIYMEFPQSCKFELSFGISLVIQFQNFNFNSPKNQIFELTHKLQDQHYQKFQGDDNYLRNKAESIDESFTMSFTKFMRSGQSRQQEESKEACKRFQMLLSQTNDSDITEVITILSSRRMTKCEEMKEDDEQYQTNKNLKKQTKKQVKQTKQIKQGTQIKQVNNIKEQSRNIINIKNEQIKVQKGFRKKK